MRWYAVLRATDFERWPDLGGWTRREAHALVSRRPESAIEYHCLAAVDAVGRDRRHRALSRCPDATISTDVLVDVRVLRGAPPAGHRHGHRRRGRAPGWRPRAERCSTGSSRSPTAMVDATPATPFARRLGFVASPGREPPAPGPFPSRPTRSRPACRGRGEGGRRRLSHLHVPGAVARRVSR